MNKANKLKKIIKQCNSALVAFSGGVDSAFLLKMAKETLPKGSLTAVTAFSESFPRKELVFCKEFCRKLRIKHKIIRTEELKDKRFTANSPLRCYYCKKELFSKLRDIALKQNLNFVLEASTVSDRYDYRPGNLAKKELNIRSPLIEAGLKKEEIRKLSKRMGLTTWDKPSLACLASRIPYGTKIHKRLLSRINQGEESLKRLGFKQVRLRHYDLLCRIEVPKEEISLLINKRNQIIDKLKNLGYNYITVDLEGFRTGSMNEVLRSKK